MGPSKSLLEMQKRARNWILSLLQERQPKRFPLTIQDMSQHHKTEAEEMQLLHFAAESGRGWAGGDAAQGGRGELCTASPALCCWCSLLPIYPSSLWLSLSFGEGWEVATSLATDWILIFEQFPNIPAASSAASCSAVPANTLPPSLLLAPGPQRLLVRARAAPGSLHPAKAPRGPGKHMGGCLTPYIFQSLLRAISGMFPLDIA